MVLYLQEIFKNIRKAQCIKSVVRKHLSLFHKSQTIFQVDRNFNKITTTVYNFIQAKEMNCFQKSLK